MKQKFKIGDKVKVISKTSNHFGLIGTVIRWDGTKVPYEVDFTGEPDTFWFPEKALSKKRKPTVHTAEYLEKKRKPTPFTATASWLEKKAKGVSPIMASPYGPKQECKQIEMLEQFRGFGNQGFNEIIVKLNEVITELNNRNSMKK